MKRTEEKFILNVSFGGKKIPLDKAQAKKYAIAGLKAEKYDSVLNNLEALAKREKVSVKEFVEKLKADKDETYKALVLEKVGGDEELAQKLIALENPSCENSADNDEIKVINKYFPQYKSVGDIPSEALIINETKNIPLFDAILRYHFFENKKCDDDLKNREKNEQGTAGSLKTKDTEYGMNYISAMLKAIKNN